MLKRIISGVIIAGLLVLVLVFMSTPVLPVFISIISGIAVFELNRVAKVKLPATVLSVAMAAFIPLWICYANNLMFGQIMSVYVIAMLIMMVKWHSELDFRQVAISIMSSIAVPCSLSTWINITQSAGKREAYYVILFAVSCAWLSDVFAYFCGMAFGKHKMTPIVSPKKTWEGAIGGILVTAAVNVGFYFLFNSKFIGTEAMPWEWYAVIPISVVLSIISIFGDLSASVIKRQNGIKDYGNLIPGHGGIMDRFDSMLFVLPVMYAIYSIITK
ncbi:MAG: phosphatidate cytidylyltransferase [Ruminococcus sp.]|nr:phosphatidate cytidylyltransferase [Candidatus Copronaster equi]